MARSDGGAFTDGIRGDIPSRTLYPQECLRRRGLRRCDSHVPGVVSAGFAGQLPLSGDQDVYGMQFEKDNDPKGDGGLRYAVTPGYLETMRIS